MRTLVGTIIAAAFALAATAVTATEAPGSAGLAGISAAPAAANGAADVAAEAAAEADALPAPQPTRTQPQAAMLRVDRATADAYTDRFNRQELDALQSGGPPAGRGGWHPLYPPRY